LTLLVVLQILLGALVAGLKAGKTYNTWPLMDGALVPGGLFLQEPWYRNVFENAATAQFNHRVMAYILVVLALWHAGRIVRMADSRHVRITAMMIAVVALAQTAVGIWTLLAWVPLSLGVAHQLGALALMAASVVHLHAIRRS
jgi:cytochrome c oxidase assembly protein subunit 15